MLSPTLTLSIRKNLVRWHTTQDIYYNKQNEPVFGIVSIDHEKMGIGKRGHVIFTVNENLVKILYYSICHLDDEMLFHFLQLAPWEVGEFHSKPVCMTEFQDCFYADCFAGRVAPEIL